VGGEEVTPRIQLVAFEERGPSHFIFVAIPDQRNRYLRTDRSVALVGCPLCKVPAGVPCLGAWNKYHGGTHHLRRSAAKKVWPQFPADVVVDDVPKNGPSREDVLEVE
jgi:hypothetical protein